MLKCKTLCCLLMLQILTSFREPLVLPLLELLIQKEGEENPFLHEFSDWKVLEHK